MGPQRHLKGFTILVFLLALMSRFVYAGVEWKTLQELELTHPPRDVTASFDGKYIFALTAGEILVYAAGDNTIVGRIPVEPAYTRIAYSADERLILSAADPARLNIVKFDRVYSINIANRPYKGPATAPVTLVVFDDYQ